MRYAALTLEFIMGIGTMIYAQDFTITATLSGFPNGTPFYVDNIHTQQTISEAVVQNGKLELKGSFPEAPVMVALKGVVGKQAFIGFILMGNEKVYVSGDRKDFPFYLKVSGSKYQDENEILKKQTRQYDKLRDSISQNIFELIKDTTREGKAKINSIAKQQQYYDHLTDSITLHFINTHLNTYAAINQLYYHRKKFSKDTLEMMYNSISEELKESIFGRKLFTYLKIGNVLKVGDLASDFTAQDVNGDVHSLKQYMGHYVLLDFSETFCAPCILSMQELKSAVQQFAGKLTVLTFCADKQREVWLKGIKRDKPDWPYLWDGKGTASETPLKYGVNSYPTIVIINPDSKIVSYLSGYSKGSILKEITKYVKVD